MIGTSIILSPLEIISVCPGGQALLSCEKTSGIVLYWMVLVPHLDTRRERVVPSQGKLVEPEFRVGFIEFNITRTSVSPLISQLLITNVTTETTIYCSEDRNENNAAMIVIIGVFVNNHC